MRRVARTLVILLVIVGLGGHGGEGVAAGDEPQCPYNVLAGTVWRDVPAVGGRVLLRYPATQPRLAATVSRLAKELDQRIWPFWQRLLGRVPVSDAEISCEHGPDGALDIYLVPPALRAAVHLTKDR